MIEPRSPGAAEFALAAERIGVTDAGKVEGRFMATGITPKIMERLRISGIQLPHSIFEEVLPVNL